MRVPLRWCGLCGSAWHSTRAGWHNHSRIGVVRHDLGIDVLPVVGAVAREGGHGTTSPLEQGADLQAVIGIPASQHRGGDLARVGVRGKVQHLPARHPSIASAVNHTVRLPRARRPASYSAQLVTLWRCLGMRCRRSALALKGMTGVSNGPRDRPGVSLHQGAPSGELCDKMILLRRLCLEWQGHLSPVVPPGATNARRSGRGGGFHCGTHEVSASARLGVGASRCSRHPSRECRRTFAASVRV
ncbi:hypothetical protein EAH89_13730 [Roseomonas nepalensis]|uniref:Uncharacterized protein n=1 Tax=Muricoccus nepalensis TaxID=1854500 RepID=A0A502G1A0_9PROT|nr:hypothetical protein EAH89_13730 [Roseomonas nepalensis]